MRINFPSVPNAMFPHGSGDFVGTLSQFISVRAMETRLFFPSETGASCASFPNSTVGTADGGCSSGVTPAGNVEELTLPAPVSSCLVLGEEVNFGEGVGGPEGVGSGGGGRSLRSCALKATCLGENFAYGCCDGDERGGGVSLKK